MDKEVRYSSAVIVEVNNFIPIVGTALMTETCFVCEEERSHTGDIAGMKTKFSFAY